MTTQTPFLTDLDLHLITEGSHYRTYEKMGAHVREVNGVKGVNFAVWAPNAEYVSVIGDFNGWRWDDHPMVHRGHAGVWEVFIPGIEVGTRYKYAVRGRHNNFHVEKADPYGFANELRPQTASKVWDISGYQWGDDAWVKNRKATSAYDAPISIYEVHAGSWMRVPEEDNRWMTFRELAPKLAAYAKQMNYTHVEFLPIGEHPFDGSWGYQQVGYFAPTSRFGTPEDFMFLVDTLHQAGIGVILDWVPAHFPDDAHGLVYFDGTHLYEHADPRQGRHQHWNTFIFNFGRREVSNFLISNALFWLDKYHIDGLRVDAVASMLYLDYGRNEGEWIPNQYGGRENLEAVEFLKRFNDQVHADFPGVITIAEESTAWPKVSHPTAEGGLGFDYKWNMGWMHDMLDYMEKDPVFRKFAHNDLTFSMMYAYSEKYMLPFSHDEVVHLKNSMLGKMPGDEWQKFASLRLLYGFMTGHPGKKLLFMGAEFGQWREWNHDTSLDWHLVDNPMHKTLQTWVSDLNKLLVTEDAMHTGDHFEWGFKWIDCADSEQSVVSFVRYDEAQENAVVFVFNFTPVPRHDYRIGLPWAGEWKEALNSDAPEYSGSGLGNMGAVTAEDVPMHGLSHSVNLVLPPLGVLVFKGVKPPEPVEPLEPADSAKPEAEAATAAKTPKAAKGTDAKTAAPEVKEASEGV